MRSKIALMLGVAMITPVFSLKAEQVTVRVYSNQEMVLNKANLDKIKNFVLKIGKRCTYCQLYNNNPCFSTESFDFYLDPDPGGPDNHPQFNLNCDPKKSDFNTLVIRSRRKLDFGDQYRDINFQQDSILVLKVNYADPKMPVGKIRDFCEQAVKEIMTVIRQTGKQGPGAIVK
jgi:hypothetical protein